jgi:hypothetical protein
MERGIFISQPRAANYSFVLFIRCAVFVNRRCRASLILRGCFPFSRLLFGKEFGLDYRTHKNGMLERGTEIIIMSCQAFLVLLIEQVVEHVTRYCPRLEVQDRSTSPRQGSGFKTASSQQLVLWA